MNKYIRRPLFALLTLLLVSCVSEMEGPTAGEGGRLRLSLANISTVTTRTTPADLGKPLASDFRLTITNGSGRTVFDDVFTENELTLPVGEYGVKVTHGTDALLAVDAPYYVGETSVEIKENETAEASITATVGNALVSVNFGRDADELARFNRFYSDYALQVGVGNFSLRITKDAPQQSIYVQAGSNVTLRFWGKLKMEDDREVSCELTSDNLPQALAAADHLILTLELPDPESALGVDISKVEVETVTLDETIPLSWLPVPTLTPSLQFDAQGNLVGTLLTSSNGYPGLTWKAVVTNAADAEVRTMQGTGVLTSAYNSSSEWPYLPQGTYKATYYIVSDDGSAKKASSREFVVPAPTGLQVTVGGYTSYTKYLEGDIDAANACERLTVYEPSVAVNIAPSLLSNSHYTYSFTYTYDGTRSAVAAGNNRYALATLPNQPVRSTVYVLRGDLTFDGVSATAQTEFRITGLPAKYAPPSESNGWKAGSEYVTFESGRVKLGNRGGILTHYNEYITNEDFYIPNTTRIVLDYDIVIHPATEGTTLMLNCGNQTIFSIDRSGGALNTNDYPYTGTSEVLTASTDIARMACSNSYGGGATCSYIKTLHYKYSK